MEEQVEGFLQAVDFVFEFGGGDFLGFDDLVEDGFDALEDLVHSLFDDSAELRAQS